MKIDLPGGDEENNMLLMLLFCGPQSFHSQYTSEFLVEERIGEESARGHVAKLLLLEQRNSP